MAITILFHAYERDITPMFKKGLFMRFSYDFFIIFLIDRVRFLQVNRGWNGTVSHIVLLEKTVCHMLLLEKDTIEGSLFFFKKLFKGIRKPLTKRSFEGHGDSFRKLKWHFQD